MDARAGVVAKKGSQSISENHIPTPPGQQQHRPGPSENADGKVNQNFPAGLRSEENNEKHKLTVESAASNRVIHKI